MHVECTRTASTGRSKADMLNIVPSWKREAEAQCIAKERKIQARVWHWEAPKPRGSADAACVVWSCYLRLSARTTVAQGQRRIRRCILRSKDEWSALNVQIQSPWQRSLQRTGGRDSIHEAQKSFEKSCLKGARKAHHQLVRAACCRSQKEAPRRVVKHRAVR